jgi:hypothetical protein
MKAKPSAAFASTVIIIFQISYVNRAREMLKISLRELFQDQELTLILPTQPGTRGPSIYFLLLINI